MPMRKILIVIAILDLTISVLSLEAEAKEFGAASDVKVMSEQEQMKLALSAAPAHVAKEAAVMVYGNDGKLKEARPGTNGYTCIPTVMNLPDPRSHVHGCGGQAVVGRHDAKRAKAVQHGTRHCLYGARRVPLETERARW